MSYEQTVIKLEPELIIDDTSSSYSHFNKSFPTLSASDDHLKKIKSEQENYKVKQIKSHKEFKCESCDKCFEKKAAKDRHYLIIHTSERPFSCDICKNSFVNKSF